MKSIRARLAALLASLVVAVSLFVPGIAKADGTDARHSVVVLEVGCYIDGEYSGYPVVKKQDDGTETVEMQFYQGTGFFVGEPGQNPIYLLTNQHLSQVYESIGAGKDQEIAGIHFKGVVKAYFDETNFVEAYFVESNARDDVALFKLDQPTSLRAPLVVRPADDSLVYEQVSLIGYPSIADNLTSDSVSTWSEKDATVTQGTVSRVFTQAGSGTQIIQTDAAMTHGNSGGPMVDSLGNVIGINTFGLEGYKDMNYAVNISVAVPLLKRNSVVYAEYNGSNAPKAEAAESESNPTQASAATPQPTLPWYVIAGIAVGIIALVAIIAVVVRKRTPSEPEVPIESTPVATPPATPPAPPTARFGEPTADVRSPAPAANPNDSGYRLQGVSGALVNKRFMIPSNTHLMIGRGEGCNITVPRGTAGVSSKHCEVWIENGRIYVKDLGSTYGTFTEPGTRLSPNQPAQIHDGNVFWLGDKAESFTVIRKRG